MMEIAPTLLDMNLYYNFHYIILRKGYKEKNLEEQILQNESKDRDNNFLGVFSSGSVLNFKLIIRYNILYYLFIYWYITDTQWKARFEITC